MDPYTTSYSSTSYTTGYGAGAGVTAPGSYTTGATPNLHYSGTHGTTGTTPGLSYSYTQETRLLQDSPLRKSIAAGDIGITTQPASYTTYSTTGAAAGTTGLSGSYHQQTTAPASYTATQYTSVPAATYTTYTTTTYTGAESPLKKSYTLTSDSAVPASYTAGTTETAKRSGAHASGTYGTTGLVGSTGLSGTYTSTTYGTTNPTSYTAPASYTATTQSTAPGGYTVLPPTESYHKSTPYLDSLFSGLRQSAVHEVKSNIENKGLETTLKTQYPTTTHSQPEVLDILKQYGLVSQDRLNDPQKVWQQINPTPEVHSYTSGLYTNLPPSSTQPTSYTSYTATQPSSYTATVPSSYTTTTTAQPTSYTSTSYTATQPAAYTSSYTSYVPTTTVTTSAVGALSSSGYTPATPTKNSGYNVTVSRGGEATKQSRTFQSLPNKSQVEPRQSLLSPYRHSMYPEFELVEDLPDRSNLIDSINIFLQKSPARESLLVSPSKVSINRKSLLSPAEIQFTSLIKEKYEDGSIYEGEGQGGRRHGKGRLTFKDGRTLQGTFRDGRAEGNAVVYFKNGKVCYEGGVDDGLYHGQGVLQCETPIPLQGNFDSSNFSSLGNHWTRYEGEFHRGKRHGKGTLLLSNGERFTGEFRDDKIQGPGSFQTRDGRTVQGTWDNNVLRRY